MAPTTNHFAEWISKQATTGDAEDFALSPEIRSPSLNILQEGIFPSRKDEEWRYTPISELLTQKPSPNTSGQSIDGKKIETLKSAIPEAHHLVFIDGAYSPDFSDGLEGIEPGLSVLELSRLNQESRQQAEAIIHDSKLSDDNIFQHIALGLSRSGLFIEVKENVEIEKLLHLIFISSSSSSSTFSNPVNIVRLGKHSQLKIVEQYASDSEISGATVPASYFRIDEGSGLTSYKLGMESSFTNHVCNSAVSVASHATFTSHQYLLGSKLTRSNMEVSFDGPGAEAILRGIYLGDESQHLDVRTYIDHAHPHCSSSQHFRGIMNGQSRGVFNGLVLVREYAQKTDAQQSNKNLLLSRDARIDTKPQLEIFADDVKCAHGATVGELDENALFYLQSRGISKTDAALMLTRAFAAEVTEEIDIESLGKYVQTRIANSLEVIG